jgi:CheY-like chemotaxis protein
MDNSGQQNQVPQAAPIPPTEPVVPATSVVPPTPDTPQAPVSTPAVIPSTPTPQAPGAVPADNRKTILLVEDDPLLVKMYSTKFTKEGFNVITAQDGEEGLRIATTTHFDFMILDVMMPKMSGIDMLTKLRSDPKYKSVPVIVLTNLTQKEEAVKVQSLEVKEYLVKANFTPSEVVAKVKQYLSQE